MEHIKENNIDISKYSEVEFDNIPSGLGCVYSIPGGLKSNIEARRKDLRIRQVGGHNEFKNYLDVYGDYIKKGRETPNVVDILNCPKGCNLGTACVDGLSDYDTESKFLKFKEEKLEEKEGMFKNRIQDMDNYFDKNLRLEDFIREYSKEQIQQIKEPYTSDYDDIFKDMLKYTDKDRELNCSACGYDTCKDMAKMIFNNINMKENCMDYIKKAIEVENKELGEKNRQVQKLLSKGKEKEEALEKALLIAKDATEAKSMFLANMSHEIRTPMNAVIGRAYLALKTELTDKQRDYISKIHNAGTSLLGIINDILDFSKIESGKLDLENIDFNLEKVMLNVSNIINPNAYHKGIEFLSYIHPDIPENLMGDPLRLGQVIINLLNNAVKFTEVGEISIDIAKINEAGNKVELQFKIKDTGIGMKKEQINKLFQAFTQADGSTTRKYGGTGLGLTISKKLVEVMGGSIWVESEYGKGSTFIFTAWFEISRINANNRIIPDCLNNLRILVVDDNLSAREIVGEYLKLMSFRVDMVSSGEEAVAAVKQCDSSDPYAVIFMDWKMPYMDGITATSIIKQSKNIDNIPHIVIVTAFEGEDIRKKAEAVNIDGYLVKPVNQSILFDVLMSTFAQDSEQILQKKVVNEVDYKFTGIRLLLAEDNEINRQIAVELLQSNGVVIDTVSNGKDAVYKVMERNYDMVLMDLQMPEMDGFEATKLIREKDKNTPIIAMTARTMVEERERCLREGMNDHVSKPIDPQVLLSTIYKWLSEYKKNELLMMQKEAVENKKIISKDMEMPKILDVNIEYGLKRVANNLELYKKLLIKYAEEGRDAVNELKNAVKTLDFAMAKRIVHTLKGVSGNIGASEIQAYAATIERVLKIGEKSENIQKMILKLEIMVANISSSIKEAFNNDTDVDTTYNKIELTIGRGCIDKLESLLMDNDSEAVDYFNSQRNTFLRCFSKEELRSLEKSLNDFNFDKALIIIKENTLDKDKGKGD